MLTSLIYLATSFAAARVNVLIGDINQFLTASAGITSVRNFTYVFRRTANFAGIRVAVAVFMAT